MCVILKTIKRWNITVRIKAILKMLRKKNLSDITSNECGSGLNPTKWPNSSLNSLMAEGKLPRLHLQSRAVKEVRHHECVHLLEAVKLLIQSQQSRLQLVLWWVNAGGILNILVCFSSELQPGQIPSLSRRRGFSPGGRFTNKMSQKNNVS